MTARPARRVSRAVLLALIGALALGSFWMREVMRKRGEDSGPVIQRTDPDYFVENFSYVRMSKTGQAEYRISGQRMVHMPADDTHVITLPVITSLSPDNPPMTARSERAVVDRNSNQIRMMDNVVLDRAATANSEAMRLTTSYLLILPDEDVMRTDKPVKITIGKSILTGTGMVAKNATRELKLGDDVQVFYQPPPARH